MRKARLAKLMETLCAYLPVHSVQMRAVLKEKEFAVFEATLAQTKMRSLLGEEARKSLRRYNALLAKAERMFEYAESRRSDYKSHLEKYSPRSREARAERAFSAAYEYLESSPEIWQVMDRPCFQGDEWPDYDPESAPRMQGSSSAYCLRDQSTVKESVFQLKLKTLRLSLAAASHRTENPTENWSKSDFDEEVL